MIPQATSRRVTVSQSRRFLTGVIAAAVVLPAIAAHAQCGPAWNIVGSPNVFRRDNTPSRLAVISPSDVWFAGSAARGTDNLQTLIQHWDGSSWKIVPSPNTTNAINLLIGLDAVDATNIWAVGFSTHDFGGSLETTLVEHWDGTAWSIIPSPNPQPHNPDLGPYEVSNELFDLAVVNGHDIWAVGESVTFSNGQPLTMHWNGNKWTAIPSPVTGDYGFLRSVDAVSAKKEWAIGTQYNQGFQEIIIRHWDGTQWNIVPAPPISGSVPVMTSIKHVAANDIWAVGYRLEVFDYRTTILHYDGTAWSVIDSPNVNERSNFLHDLTVVAKNDIYAVGAFETDFATGESLVMHWDGNAWTIMPSPNRSDSLNELFTVAAVGPNDVWAAGDDFGAANYETFVVHLTDPCATPTMHIANIAPSSQTLSNGQFRVRAAVTVKDAGNAAVADAVVTMQFTRPDGQMITRTANTNPAGVAASTITSSVTGTYTIAVTAVAKAGSTYDPGSNVETSDTVTIP